MGNAVQPRMCRKPPIVMAEAASRPAAPPRRAIVAACKQRPGAVHEEEAARRRSRRGREVAAAAVVTTVKIVLKRRDAEELVARLNARGKASTERKARMTELIKCELRARDDNDGVGGCGGAAASPPASCWDAWRPKLTPIQEDC